MVSSRYMFVYKCEAKTLEKYFVPGISDRSTAVASEVVELARWAEWPPLRSSIPQAPDQSLILIMLTYCFQKNFVQWMVSTLFFIDSLISGLAVFKFKFILKPTPLHYNVTMRTLMLMYLVTLNNSYLRHFTPEDVLQQTQV